MKFGLYVHLPFCLQKCTYCDFATADWEGGVHDKKYLAKLLTEIRRRSASVPYKKVDTLYLGGGTPSLFPPEHILTLLDELAINGFDIGEINEFTIEINPGTITQQLLDSYLRLGINRFSVGAQTFNEKQLATVGRKHSASQTRDTLELLDSHGLNYTFDLLFGLPGQTLNDLEYDLSELDKFSPRHLSAYCLTVPEAHPLNRLRPPDEVEAKMYELIEGHLNASGMNRYEISSYSKPGFESQHNKLYWNDHSYWGLGMSAHSYFKDWGEWGTRFSNPTTIGGYQKSLDSVWPPLSSSSNFEILKSHESLTDYLHVSFRQMSGLKKSDFVNKFGETTWQRISPQFERLLQRELLEPSEAGYRLSRQGKLLPNLVFEEFTYLAFPT